MELWTLTEAAAYLKCNADYLRKRTKRGEVPAQKFGRLWRYRREALDEWIAQGCPRADQQPGLFDQGAKP